MEVRRSEEGVGRLGELELRLRDQEGERKKRETKRERQRRYIERKGTQSQMPLQPQDVTPVHLYSRFFQNLEGHHHF